MDTFLGHQTTVDFYGCKSDKISSCQFIEDTLLKAARILNLTVVNTTIHSFSPIGVSGVIVIEESHIAIHTWPEHNYIAIDFFTCNKSYNLKKGLEWLKEEFKAERLSQEVIKRGSLKNIEDFKV
ncbi:S-adenosylmethionine decarboxylase proenzyme [Flavivirga aquatica]|uniref:S-adenosylmethionine decarboxylase proenzyme n=1 Tax=Flavivirga aquatica TaxID=1849968 RepID=A0A1E5TDF4_9FLAO|nr:adenosylmethionine decarboxylase [Flavivirga aquatica]OEK09391.1 S-adenosylmethionine decarboxylase proenzyme [Flavivirga aquatica]